MLTNSNDLSHNSLKTLLQEANNAVASSSVSTSYVTGCPILPATTKGLDESGITHLQKLIEERDVEIISLKRRLDEKTTLCNEAEVTIQRLLMTLPQYAICNSHP